MLEETDRLTEEIGRLNEELEDTKRDLRAALEDNEELEAKLLEMKNEIDSAVYTLKRLI